MDRTTFTIRRAACACYFACPGLAYGLLTARMPALKSGTHADDAQIGIMLLCVGLSSLLALFCSAALIARLGSRTVLLGGSLFMLLGTCLCGLAVNPVQLGIFCAMTGFGMGFTDVSMNTQGILLERRYSTACMSSMHAAYSLGGVFGSLSGAVFAAFGLSYFLNAASVLGGYALLSLWAGRRLLKEARGAETGRTTGSLLHAVPLFVLLCGLMSMLAYAIEGSVGEWGSLLLHDAKGASEQVAALVFAVFSLAVVVCRLFGDGLRTRWGDFRLVFTGAVLAFLGLALVLLSAWPLLCLGGYALMGFGLAPIVPVLFSRAGALPTVAPRKASAVVSIMSYSGLLFFPPLLGFIAQKKSLPEALLVVLFACALLAAGAFVLKKTHH